MSTYRGQKKKKGAWTSLHLLPSRCFWARGEPSSRSRTQSWGNSVETDYLEERHHHQSEVNSVLKKSAWKSKGSLLLKMLKARDGDCRVRSLILCWGSIPHWFPIQAYKVLLTLLWPPDLCQEAPVLHAERSPALTQGHLEWQKWGQLPWLWSHWTEVSISKSGLTWMILQESLLLLIAYNYNSDTSFKLGFN